jgi:hypothetical protein
MILENKHVVYVECEWKSKCDVLMCLVFSVIVFLLFHDYTMYSGKVLDSVKKLGVELSFLSQNPF